MNRSSEDWKDALRLAIKIAGSQAALATASGVNSQSTVSEWLNEDRPIPEVRCIAIERFTQGKVRCERLRPDLTWHRKRAASWPWNGGKPLVDFAPEVANAAP